MVVVAAAAAAAAAVRERGRGGKGVIRWLVGLAGKRRRTGERGGRGK